MTTWIAAKAVEGQEWQLDVLAAPFGDKATADADGEWFSAETQFHADKWPSPPAVYYHGIGSDTLPYLGRTLKRWVDAAGHWVRIELEHGTEEAARLARTLIEKARKGLVAASSGSIAHLVRRDASGHIREWPLTEVSIFETDSGKRPANRYAVVLPVMKAVYAAAGLDLPGDIEDDPEVGPEAEESAAPAGGSGDNNDSNLPGDDDMDPNEMDTKIASAVDAALKAMEERHAAKAEADAKRKAEIDAAVEAALKAEREKAAADNRLPGGAPYVTKFNDQKYDNLEPDDMALLIGILDAPTSQGMKSTHTAEGRPKYGDRELALKSLAYKMEGAEAKGSAPAHLGMKALSSAAGRAMKANEVMQSTLANYGDEWIGVAYSQRLWEAIRMGTFVVDNLPAMEMPPGHESMVIPLEAADPTFYKVAQVATSANPSSTLGTPVATVPSSQMRTAQKSVTLSKMGCRVLWSGEMEEDSLIPFVAQLRRQIEKAGAQQMEHAIIDGDTDTTASTNINDIAGTPAATDLFLMCNGFRKLPLITNTANSRDATTLTVEDYLETLKLMGVAGQNAANQGAVDFIIDPWVHYKSLELGEVKTRDVFSAPTLENGRLTGMWGHRIHVSHFMCYAGVLAGTVSTDAYKLKSQSADGKVDQDTESDNVDGSILAVRWDQWLLAYRRRMTIETNRIAHADATEIVALARWGLAFRDNEASAISYGVTL